MRAVSSTYQQLIAGKHYAEIKVSVDGVDYGQSHIIALSTDTGALSERKPSVGCCVAGQITLKMFNPNATISRMASIKPYYRLTDGTNTSEWVQKGEYFIDTRSVDENGVLTLKGYDAMLKAEQVMYTDDTTQTTYPKDDIDVVEDIAYLMGIDIDGRVYDIITQEYQVQYPGYNDTGLTLREVLGYIGSMYAGNWIISDEGKLLLLRLIEVQQFYLADELGNALLFGNDDTYIWWEK